MQESGTKSILIIDDDEGILFALTAMLEDEGYEVKTAENGQAALDLLQKEGLPRLILLDMKMPVMNGWQFAAEFEKRHDHQVPIVVMTAAADAKQRAKDIHAEDWLEKPFRLEKLQELLKKYLEPKPSYGIA